MSSVAPSYYTQQPHGTPHSLSRDHSRVLDELIRLPQWVAWRLECRHNAAPDAKPTKVPYSPTTDTLASSTDPSTWGTYAEAIAMVRAGKASGVGFVFSANDPYFGIDLDGVRDPESGELEPWASDIVDRFGTYTEPSPSGGGVHLIGRGVKPASNSRKGRQIECYDRERFFTMTLEPLRGYEELRDCHEQLVAWHREMWPQVDRSLDAAPVALTLEDQDIIERLLSESTGKGAALMRGNAGEYPSHSEARAALAWKACFYTDSVDQVARILLASSLFKPGLKEQERERKARQDATAAVDSYAGKRYEPRPSAPAARIIRPRDTPATSISDQLTTDELRARLARAEAERDAYRDAFTAVTDIVAIEEMDPSSRCASVGVLLLGLEFQARGRKTSKKGDYHMPASWIGRYSGQKPQTVNRQLKRLAEAEVIDREVRQERYTQAVEMVDDDGVIEVDTFERNGNKNYIALPENVLDIVPRLKNYKKPDGAPKRGGARVPNCDKHPGAGIVKRTAYYCEVCFYEHEHGQAPCPDPLSMSDPVRAHRDDVEAEEAARASSHIKLASDTPTVTIGAIKLAPDVLDPPTPIKLESDPTPRRGVFPWTDPTPRKDPPRREPKPSGLCIEDGCMNALPPGGKYYCEQHGGVPASSSREGVAS